MAEGSSSPSSFSAAAAKAEEERAELLDRMLTRFAIADDDKLEPALVKTLPYSIASLSAPSPSIRMMVGQTQYSIRKLIDDPPAMHTMFESLMDIHDHIESVLEHISATADKECRQGGRVRE
ncbi:uncharacterized protein LOC109725454 [Ananas comosus]|uniref:Uncharacterized protein LOC109725454 n=2 Tax=Ananas comosus TaxID=4615 RepID=A0A6P5GX30_ANACO|nr:uncharacterized protein LOC109725454 [Ananas comosus]CAD1824540.1 unnamed protein product [Ananas comosus var. bracteatus]